MTASSTHHLVPLDPQSRAIPAGEPVGIFADGWVRARSAFKFVALDAITSMSLEIWSPHAEPLTLTLALGEEPAVTLTAPTGGVAVLGYALHAAPSTQFTIELLADREQQLSATDSRHASYILRCIGLY